MVHNIKMHLTFLRFLFPHIGTHWERQEIETETGRTLVSSLFLSPGVRLLPYTSSLERDPFLVSRILSLPLRSSLL